MLLIFSFLRVSTNSRSEFSGSGSTSISSGAASQQSRQMNLWAELGIGLVRFWKPQTAHVRATRPSPANPESK
jgi:hypothetical protein